MNNIIIRKIKPTDWLLFKELKLESLKVFPEAFTQSFEEESLLTDQDWQTRVSEYAKEEKSIMYLAFDDQKVIGKVGAYFGDTSKTKHIAIVIGMYVKKEYQGQGVGKQLFTSLLTDLKARPEIKKINLDVTTTQVSAIHLYESLGFQKIGELKKEYLIDGKFYDVFEMEKYLV